MSDDPLLKAKVGLSDKGAELEMAVGSQAPGMLAKLFPQAAFRSQARRLISDRLLENIMNGRPIDAADAEYLSSLLKPAEARWINQKMLCQRAIELAETVPPRPALPPHESDATTATERPKATADDWIAKFWEDASLVSDELLREIYARILVKESSQAGACSMRTLKVVRYLDRDTADTFAKFVPLLLDNDWVPQAHDLLSAHGVTFSDILDLIDAELLQSESELILTPKTDITYFFWGDKALRVTGAKTLEIPAYCLTRAGSELARIANVQHDFNYLKKVAQWLMNLDNISETKREIAWANWPQERNAALLAQQDWQSF